MTSVTKAKRPLTDKQEENEKAQLAHTGLKSSAQYLQAFAVPTELEYSEDSHQSNHSEDRQ